MIAPLIEAARRRMIARVIRAEFDEEYYRREYPAALKGVSDPAAHYVRVGAQRGYDPSPDFSTRFYSTAYPDVPQAGANPFAHYLTHGRAEGRHPSEYALLETSFDREFYLARYPDVAASGADPISHYIASGAAEGRDPAPWFSTSDYESAAPHVRRLPLSAFAHYLATGRKQGFLAKKCAAANPDFALLTTRRGQDPQAAEDMLVKRELDVVSRLSTGVLGEMVARAAEMDPLVRHPRRAWVTPNFSPYGTAAIELAAAITRIQSDADDRPAKAVVAMPHCRMSGAARVAGELTHALAAMHGADNVVVLRTDLSQFDHPEWFPEGCRIVDFAGASAGVGQRQQKELLLFMAIRAFAPEHVVNVNSNLFWTMMVRFGPAMKAETSVFSYLFCTEINEEGAEGGYPVQYFIETFETHHGLITDSAFLAETLRHRFALTDELAARIQPIATPLREERPAAAAPPGGDRRPQIFWAGRFDRQKRLDIVYEIAKRLPGADFRVWGKPVLDQKYDAGAPPANIAFQGIYDDFTDLPLGECDLWLYTAAWDGVPTILIDVAASGAPLVSSLVGGIGDVLSPGGASLIEDIEDVDGFVAAIEAVLADTASARERAARLRDETLSRRSADNYLADVRGFIERAGA